MEQWLPIPKHEHYQVSDRGRVRSMPKTVKSQVRSWFKVAGRVLRPAKLKSGYMQVMLGRKRNAYVHELVLEAFRGPRPKGFTASHLNGVRNDNRLENLAWESWKENNGRQVEHGTVCRGERNGHAKLTPRDVLEIRAVIKPWHGYFAAVARLCGVGRSTIEDAYKRRTWRHL